MIITAEDPSYRVLTEWLIFHKACSFESNFESKKWNSFFFLLSQVCFLMTSTILRMIYFYHRIHFSSKFIVLLIQFGLFICCGLFQESIEENIQNLCLKISWGSWHIKNRRDKDLGSSSLYLHSNIQYRKGNK